MNELQPRCHVIPLSERKVVVYMPLQLDGAHLGPRMAVRTLEDFQAWVHNDEAPSRCGAPAGEPCHNSRQNCVGWLPRAGGSLRRFTYLGPELTAEMLES